MARYVYLNNGNMMPTLGIGCFRTQSPPSDWVQAVVDAVEVGYRFIDTAWIHGNEQEVGFAIQSTIRTGCVAREELFVSAKLWNNFHKKEHVVPALQRSLRALRLSYIDLYIINWPFGFKENVGILPLFQKAKGYSDVDYIETWKGMEMCVNMGLAKNIGVSNFNSQQIDRLLQNCTIKPVCNEIEVHYEFTNSKLVKYCQERQVVVISYYPLGRSQLGGLPKFPEPPIPDPGIKQIAQRHGRTAYQVVLNHLINSGIVVVPGCVSKIRISENFGVFDWELDAEGQKYMNSLDMGSRIFHMALYADHPLYPFKTEF